MANFLFQRYGNNQQRNIQQRNNQNIISQLMSLRKNPGGILDILFQSGKINQQQYNELQPYKNDPEAIGRYLINNGWSDQIKQSEQLANQLKQ